MTMISAQSMEDTSGKIVLTIDMDQAIAHQGLTTIAVSVAAEETAT